MTELEEAWKRFDFEYPRRDIAIGDTVCWWPHVTIFGTPAQGAAWVEGEVTGRVGDSWRIKVTETSGDEVEINQWIQISGEIDTLPGTLIRSLRKLANDDVERAR